MSNFPNKLKKIRIDNGLTQSQLAKSLHVSQNAIYNWENGKREPNLDMMKEIAKTFNIALYVLVDDKYELDNVTSEAYKNKARFLGDTEMEKPPAFTAPINNNHNAIIIDTTTDKNNPVYTIQKKMENGEKLTPTEASIYSKYVINGINSIKQSIESLSESIKQSYLKHYKLLNEKGIAEADKQIANVIERETKQIQEQLEGQLELLTKIPEYQKKSPNTP